MNDPYVCLATIADVNLARVAAARLQSEGIDSRLHGESLGPFPVTIGRLAETQLWVLADQQETATSVLADLGIDCEPSV
ncbi:MAG: hypothetical protein QNL12_03180 [Acidimicrobiia bacterium]|nr:hypothetical protein [Acidimicrobiia bacterium]MDX2466290.1 hypothetical protein [Acidimicrobiia bacterium]